MNQKNRNALINLTVITILSFAFIFIGIRFVLDNTVNARNIIAFSGLSLALGLISTVLFMMRPRIGYLIFCVGTFVGYITMYRSFLSDFNGWGDLTGLMSLFVWILIGLGAGLVVQLGFYLYNKFKKKE